MDFRCKQSLTSHRNVRDEVDAVAVFAVNYTGSCLIHECVQEKQRETVKQVDIQFIERTLVGQEEGVGFVVVGLIS